MEFMKDRIVVTSYQTCAKDFVEITWDGCKPEPRHQPITLIFLCSGCHSWNGNGGGVDVGQNLLAISCGFESFSNTLKDLHSCQRLDETRNRKLMDSVADPEIIVLKVMERLATPCKNLTSSLKEFSFWVLWGSNSALKVLSSI